MAIRIQSCSMETVGRDWHERCSAQVSSRLIIWESLRTFEVRVYGVFGLKVGYTLFSHACYRKL